MAQARLSQSETESIKELFSLINERIELQKEIAAYKHYTNMPSYIPGQEQQVLANTRALAHNYHLDLQSVQAFIEVQMRAGVDVQLKWRNHWKKTEFPPEHLIKELNGYLRPELSRLTNKIIANIGKHIELINNPDYFDELAALFASSVDAHFLGSNQKDSILKTLVHIKKA